MSCDGNAQQREIQYLKSKILALQHENTQLKQQLNSMNEQAISATSRTGEYVMGDKAEIYCHATEDKNSNSQCLITQASSPEAKITLFRNLFIGRTDVFAKRWSSNKTGKSGYQPVCENEWKPGICQKAAGMKCAKCPYRKLQILTNEVIFRHLTGDEVIGIYPLLEDETCHFLAIDFDDGNYQAESVMFKNICTKLHISAYIERSRSGCGAHVWIFFNERVPAILARQLGTLLLSEAMDENPSISFKSYDRLFPNQDYMPKGGFGNLIALPLQKLARQQGNSVFVNDDFRPYPDQWAFLSGIVKMGISEINAAVSVLSKQTRTIEHDKEHPWETFASKPLTAQDFPPVLNIIESNLLYIPKDELSPKALRQIRQLAAFSNPDFYKAATLRMPIYNKPRVISTSEEFDGYIGLPRGCKNQLIQLLSQSNTQYQVEDKRNPGNAITVSFKGVLRPEQQEAIAAMSPHEIGVLAASTGFGKTVVAAAMIAQRGVNTLILVHSRALLSQWEKALNTFLDIKAEPPQAQTPKRGPKRKWSPIGTIGDGKQRVSGIVDIAIMQSLFDDKEVKHCVKEYGMIIVDECHHVPAVNFERILKFANAKFVYGLSATPKRADGHHPIITMQCGEVRYSVDALTQSKQHGFAHLVIPKLTGTNLNIPPESVIAEIYSKLAEDESRNQLIINDVVIVISQCRTPIILTERTQHVKTLSAKLRHELDTIGEDAKIIELVGTMSAKERREALGVLESIQSNEKVVIIATGRLVGEGFDYARLDTLFLAMPIAWKGKVTQYAGRLHRPFPGKKEVRIYDYIDSEIPVLNRMYAKRTKVYKEIGYKISNKQENT